MALAGAGACMGTVYAGRELLALLYWNTTHSLVAALLFPVPQAGEFSVLGVYTNDSYAGSPYISLSGLHPMHVCWGLLLVGAGSGTGYSMDTTPIDTIPLDLYPTLDCSYWHLVELVYIPIHGSLYYYSPPAGGGSWSCTCS